LCSCTLPWSDLSLWGPLGTEARRFGRNQVRKTGTEHGRGERCPNLLGLESRCPIGRPEHGARGPGRALGDATPNRLKHWSGYVLRLIRQQPRHKRRGIADVLPVNVAPFRSAGVYVGNFGHARQRAWTVCVDSDTVFQRLAASAGRKVCDATLHGSVSGARRNAHEQGIGNRVNHRGVGLLASVESFAPIVQRVLGAGEGAFQMHAHERVENQLPPDPQDHLCADCRHC
jgi:hypothetical protein